MTLLQPFNALVLWLSLLMVTSSINTDKPEEKIYSCPVIQCSAPAVSGLPGRDGRDGQGEKGERDFFWSTYPQYTLCNFMVEISKASTVLTNCFKSFDFEEHQEDCLKNEKDTFDNGKSLCAKAGSALAFPRNKAENTALKDLIRPSKQAYVGICEQTECTFMYLKGGAVTYTNWNVGEPNNVKNEDCAVIQDSGKWNDVNCSNLHASIICEFLS
ncbi:LOW QUALITY PROTEIN: mannose-binding protein-like [Chlamydotis macqueenii]